MCRNASATGSVSLTSRWWAFARAAPRYRKGPSPDRRSHAAATVGPVRAPGSKAIGTWSGGRFLRFGEAIDEARLQGLLRPGRGIDTVLTADAYGQGEADSLLGWALGGIPRDGYCLVGAVGHDFYEGERDGPRGFPRFTHPRLRGPDQYGSYL